MSSRLPDFPDLRPDVAEIARRILGEPNKQLSTRQQLRFGTNGSVSVEIAGPKRGQWYDFEVQQGGGPWELLTVKGGMANGAAVKWLRSQLGIEIPQAAKGARDLSRPTTTATNAAISSSRSAASSRRPSGSDSRTAKAAGHGTSRVFGACPTSCPR